MQKKAQKLKVGTFCILFPETLLTQPLTIGNARVFTSERVDFIFLSVEEQNLRGGLETSFPLDIFLSSTTLLKTIMYLQQFEQNSQPSGIGKKVHLFTPDQLPLAESCLGSPNFQNLEQIY